MEDKQQTIKYLTLLKRELTDKVEKLQIPVRQAQNDLLVVSKALEVVLRPEILATAEVAGFPLRAIRNMTQTQALVEIAKYNGGTLRALEAKPILIAAGLMKNSKNAAHMVSGTINRSGLFERTARGVYRLKSRAVVDARPATAADLERIVN